MISGNMGVKRWGAEQVMYNSQADTVIRSFRKWNLSVVKERKIDEGSVVKIEEKRKVFYTSVEKIVSVKKMEQYETIVTFMVLGAGLVKFGPSWTPNTQVVASHAPP